MNGMISDYSLPTASIWNITVIGFNVTFDRPNWIEGMVLSRWELKDGKGKRHGEDAGRSVGNPD